MSIQWYPGHMRKATREMTKILSSVDVILEVLDARAPISTSNPVIKEITQGKPIITLLNKSDLSDPIHNEKWIDYFKQKQTLLINAMTNESCKKIIDLISALTRKKIGKNTLAMVLGIPNVGKSSIINMLAGRKITKTGNEPAITKGQQKVNLRNGIMLLDTPGVLWPKIEDPESGLKLAALGSIRNTAVAYDQIAPYIIKSLNQKYPETLKDRFKIESLTSDEYKTIETLAKKRGCISRGGITDITRISEIIVDEFRRGLLGKVSLETPLLNSKLLNPKYLKES